MFNNLLLNKGGVMLTYYNLPHCTIYEISYVFWNKSVMENYEYKLQSS